MTSSMVCNRLGVTKYESFFWTWDPPIRRKPGWRGKGRQIHGESTGTSLQERITLALLRATPSHGARTDQGSNEGVEKYRLRLM